MGDLVLFVDVVVRGTDNAFGDHPADAVACKDMALLTVTLPAMVSPEG